MNNPTGGELKHCVVCDGWMLADDFPRHQCERMAERTDRQAQTDPWDAAMEALKRLARDIGTVDDIAGRRSDPDRDHQQMRARLRAWRVEILKALDILEARPQSDAAGIARTANALLRERDAQIAELTKAVQGNALAVVKANDAASQQIASLTAQVEQQTQGYTLKGLSNYFGWGLESDRDVWQFAASREHTLRLAQELLETSRSDAGTAADAIRDRIDTLRAERDAAQQERDSIAKQLHAEVMSERERRVAAQEGITLKYVPELEAAQQENQTLREALKAAWCELIQHDDQPWVKTLAGQVRVVGLFASPRPQESQP